MFSDRAVYGSELVLCLGASTTGTTGAAAGAVAVLVVLHALSARAIDPARIACFIFYLSKVIKTPIV
jgi:hypothetical protein